MSAWEGVGAAYDASYAALCAGTNDALITALGPGSGRCALDAGSGTGGLSACLHDAGWRVTGCEPEDSMREVAARRHPEITFAVDALPALAFPDAAFDAVTANFVLNHVDDPRRSAAELARVAISGGTLAATIWSVSPSWFWLAVCERAGLQPSTGGRLSADKDFERSATGFERMLVGGGWRGVEVVEQSWTWQAAPALLWASVDGGVASAGAFYQSLDDSERKLFRGAFDALCAEQVKGGVIALEHTAAIAVGTAA